MIRDEMIVLVVVKLVFSIVSYKKVLPISDVGPWNESLLSTTLSQLVWLGDVRGVTSVFSPVRECSRHEIGTVFRQCWRICRCS